MDSENLIRQSLGKMFLVLLCAMSLCQVSYPQETQGSTTATAQPQSSTPTEAQPTASPNLSQTTADGLKWFFTVVVYPAVVAGVFLLLVSCIVYIIGQGHGFGYVRRATGALLPLLFLTFMLLVTDKADDPVKSVFLNKNPFFYVLVGIVLGIALVELGKHLLKTDDDRWGSIYNLFLSFMFVFLLYSIMKGFLDSLIYFLFSMIMSAGCDIVFGRPMESKTPPSPTISTESKRTRPSSPPVSERAARPRSSNDIGRVEPDLELRRDLPLKERPYPPSTPKPRDPEL